jgi:flavin reductase (DIM6/NTAB) family NADH-FMN oxidoreductase RutF
LFYEPPKANHDLPYSPFKALVAPRPIGWISTLSESGVANLAPYSFFNAIASNPDMVMFSSQQWKDTVTNIEKTGEFVCNYVTEAMSDAMNASSVSAPPGVDEFEIAGLDKEASKLVKPPRVAGIAAALECRMTRIIEIEDVRGKSSNHFMVIGQVMGTYINDAYLTNGRFDVAKARPLTRMGYHDYQHFGEIFELSRPNWQG